METSRALEVVAAIDQDEAAQRTYLTNHPGPALRLDLGTVRAATLAGFAAEAWVLSLPCQPFTRRGRRRDVDDPRCAALLRLVELLPDLAPRRLLVENVVGFAASRACAGLVAALDRAGLEWRIEELCPSALGWPIRRPRQYLLASRDGFPPAFRFPEGLTLRACMRLAGNTVHVAAVRAAARALAPHPAASGAGRRS